MQFSRLARMLPILSLSAFVMLFGQNCSKGFRLADDGLMDFSSLVGEGTVYDGSRLYQINCSSCHGALESSAKKGATVLGITIALNNQAEMKHIQLSPEEIEAIARVLGGGNIGQTEAPPVSTVQATCSPTAVRGLGKRGVRRLTRIEIENSVNALNLPNAWIHLNGMQEYPEPTVVEEVSSFDQLYSTKQAMVWTRVVDAMATAYSQNRGNIYDGCFGASSITTTCWQGFFRTMGRKIYRRPMLDAEITRMTNAVSSLSAEEGAYKAFHMLFRSPDFLFHLESGVSDDGKRVRLSDHEIANRISFALTAEPPDKTLADAADAGQLQTLPQVEAQVRRLIESDKAKKKLQSLFAEWLQFSKISTPNTIYQDWFNDLGLSDGMERVYRQEILDYLYYVIWERKGSYRELMTSTIGFPRAQGIWYGKVGQGQMYSALSGIYGTDKFANFAPENTAPRPFPAPNHPGLVFRAGLLASAKMSTDIIKRGVYVKRRIFCDVMPSPDFSVVTARLGELGDIDHHKTPNFQVVNMKTSGATCMTCHSTINPMGTAFESFDSLGKLRSVEKVYFDNNYYKPPTEHPLPGPVSNVKLGQKTVTVSSATQFAEEVAVNRQAQACMASFALRHFERRYETEADGCALSDAIKPIDEGKPVLDVFIKSLANEDIFWRKL